MKSALAAKDKVCVSSKEIRVSDISFPYFELFARCGKDFYGGLKGKN